MPKATRYKSVIKTGNSLYVVIPSIFVKKMGIKPGDIAEAHFDIKTCTITYTFKDPRQQVLV